MDNLVSEIQEAMKQHKTINQHVQNKRPFPQITRITLLGDAAFPVKVAVGGQVGAQGVFYIYRRNMTWLFHPPQRAAQLR